MTELKKFEHEGGAIVVATPGRLQYVLENQAEQFKVKSLEVLILDEADRYGSNDYEPIL